jgi:hypothetical protein
LTIDHCPLTIDRSIRKREAVTQDQDLVNRALWAHIGGRGFLNRYLTRPKYANLLR